MGESCTVTGNVGWTARIAWPTAEGAPFDAIACGRTAAPAERTETTFRKRLRSIIAFRRHFPFLPARPRRERWTHQCVGWCGSNVAHGPLVERHRRHPVLGTVVRATMLPAGACTLTVPLPPV